MPNQGHQRHDAREALRDRREGRSSTPRDYGSNQDRQDRIKFDPSLVKGGGSFAPQDNTRTDTELQSHQGHGQSIPWLLQKLTEFDAWLGSNREKPRYTEGDPRATQGKVWGRDAGGEQIYGSSTHDEGIAWQPGPNTYLYDSEELDSYGAYVELTSEPPGPGGLLKVLEKVKPEDLIRAIELMKGLGELSDHTIEWLEKNGYLEGETTTDTPFTGESSFGKGGEKDTPDPVVLDDTIESVPENGSGDLSTVDKGQSQWGFKSDGTVDAGPTTTRKKGETDPQTTPTTTTTKKKWGPEDADYAALNPTDGRKLVHYQALFLDNMPPTTSLDLMVYDDGSAVVLRQETTWHDGTTTSTPWTVYKTLPKGSVPESMIPRVEALFGAF